MRKTAKQEIDVVNTYDMMRLCPGHACDNRHPHTCLSQGRLFAPSTSPIISPRLSPYENESLLKNKVLKGLFKGCYWNVIKNMSLLKVCRLSLKRWLCPVSPLSRLNRDLKWRRVRGPQQVPVPRRHHPLAGHCQKPPDPPAGGAHQQQQHM